jgi:uncharacterized protein
MTTGHLIEGHPMSQSETPWALVTGASSGLGVALATSLAARGTNLVLAARRERPMQELAARLAQQHSVTAVCEAIDLAASGSASGLQQRLEERGIEPEILINNAGIGLGGAFVEQDLDRLRSMLQLDIVTLTELTQIFGRRMAARGRGRILLVASMAAYLPTPRLAAYGAAKAYVLSLGEALNVELAPNVGVTVLSPGLMDTEFNSVADYNAPRTGQLSKLAPETVAKIGLDAMFAGKPSVIAGSINRAMGFMSRFVPRSAQARAIYNMK